MKVIEILKRTNDKLEPVSDSVLTYIESLGDKIPEYLENNMGKIYFIFFILTLFGIKEGYEQRGYFGIGGEVMIILIPIILKFYLEMRKSDKEYYKLLEEIEEIDQIIEDIEKKEGDKKC